MTPVNAASATRWQGRKWKATAGFCSLHSVESWLDTAMVEDGEKPDIEAAAEAQRVEWFERLQPRSTQPLGPNGGRGKLVNMRGGMSMANVDRGRNGRTKARHSSKAPQNIDRTLRQAKALELRRAGYTYLEIAQVKSLGYSSPGHVGKDLQNLFQAMLDEPARDVLALELSRIEALVRYLWGAVRDGDLAATDRLLKVLQIKHQLLGLNQPVRHEVVTTDTMNTEINRLTAELNKLEAGHPQKVIEGEWVSSSGVPDFEGRVPGQKEPPEGGGNNEVREAQVRDINERRRQS